MELAQRRWIGSGERQAPGRELVQDEPQGVEVGSFGGGRGPPLRRQVGRRAEELGRFAVRLGSAARQRARDTEVGDVDAPFAIDENVRRLEVEVENPCLVRRGERLAQADADSHHLPGRQPSRPCEAGAEVLPLDQLHGQEENTGVLADVVDPADAGMRDLPREAHLPCQPTLLGVVVALHFLQGDGDAQHAIVGGVDLAHPSLPDVPLDAVPPCEDLALAEAALAREPAQAYAE